VFISPLSEVVGNARVENVIAFIRHYVDIVLLVHIRLCLDCHVAIAPRNDKQADNFTSLNLARSQKYQKFFIALGAEYRRGNQPTQP